MLTAQELYQFTEPRQLPPLPFRHNSALRTFAQICSRRITKKYRPSRLYSWDSVNPKVTARQQNPPNYESPEALGTASDVLTHPNTKSIVNLRWLKPGAAPPPSCAHESS